MVYCSTCISFFTSSLEVARAQYYSVPWLDFILVRVLCLSSTGVLQQSILNSVPAQQDNFAARVSQIWTVTGTLLPSSCSDFYSSPFSLRSHCVVCQWMSPVPIARVHGTTSKGRLSLAFAPLLVTLLFM